MLHALVASGVHANLVSFGSASLFVSFFVALMVHGLKLDNKPPFVTYD